MEIVRRAVRERVHRLVETDARDLARPPGDMGLFGPGSVAWEVHGDFTAMMIGGVAALLLQMLHPAALAGVWDHSDFRRDMLGRLRRTARFVSGTTYGSTEAAERLIVRVRRVHDRVVGDLPGGGRYAANDPTLLTWVHVAEAVCFLAAHQRYRGALPRPAQDRYFAEMAGLARRLGAGDVPETRRTVNDYLHAMRPALRADDRTREVARALMSQPPPSPDMAPLGSVFLQAGVDILPGWARSMHGLSVPATRRPLVRGSARAAGAVLRWALRDG